MLDISTVSIYSKDEQHKYAIVYCQNNMFLIAYEQKYVYVCILTAVDRPLLLDMRVGGIKEWKAVISSTLQRLRVPKDPVTCHEYIIHRFTNIDISAIKAITDELYIYMSKHQLPLKTYIKLGIDNGVILSRCAERFICTVEDISYLFDRNFRVYAIGNSYEWILADEMVNIESCFDKGSKANLVIKTALRKTILKYDQERCSQ